MFKRGDKAAVEITKGCLMYNGRNEGEMVPVTITRVNPKTYSVKMHDGVGFRITKDNPHLHKV